MFPKLSLSKARTKHEEARTMLRKGIDPCQQKTARKKAAQQQDKANQQAQLIHAMTFQVVAEKWLEVRRTKIAASTLKKDKYRASFISWFTIYPRWIAGLWQRNVGVRFAHHQPTSG